MTITPRTSIRSLAISTLSPVHVGCDEVYEPSGFVIHDGLLHVLDPADLTAALTDNERRQLAGLADQRDPIGALQRFFRDSAARFAGFASQQVAVAEAIAREYQQKAGQATQRGAAGEATYNLFPIARTAYRPFDGTPYLPGSSLKGSMRTAWLNQLLLNVPRQPDRQTSARSLEERLLGYSAGKFENDPLRHLALADAHPEEAGTPPPTRVLYAISKKKRPPRADERNSPELKVFLETIPDALPAAFIGEIRLDNEKMRWNSLCDACNAFYRPQLEAELDHPVLGERLDAGWKRLIGGLLDRELGELIGARQGFLLRVGRHSGAESVTLDGWRRIKILGARVDGKQTSDYRPNTTEKRYASLTRSSDGGLLPFGWLWVDACDDRHRHLSDAIRQKLAERSLPLREAHADRLWRLEEKAEQRAASAAAVLERQRAEQATARAEVEARELRAKALAEMTPNCRRIEEFIADFAARAEQLRGKPENANGVYHGKARALARDAAAWDHAERVAAADAVEEWLPKVVRVDIRDERKKLKLASLRSA